MRPRVRERVRAFLGVWAPLIVGLFLMAIAVNFLLTPRLPDKNPVFVLDPVAAAICGGAVIVVGGLLILSTAGRWRKVRLARRGG